MKKLTIKQLSIRITKPSTGHDSSPSVSEK